MSASEYTEVGYLKKTLGLKGEIRCVLYDEFGTSFPNLEAIFLLIQGHYLPYFIEYTRQSKDLVIKIDEFNTPEEAKSFIGKKIWIHSDYIHLFEAHEAHDDLAALNDYKVYVQDNQVGIIKEIVQYPQQLMATLITEGKEILIPLVEDYIIGLDHEVKTIHLDLPDGLLDL